ncbi:MAG: peptidylprolyl isomerase [Tissierellia bacterium]|nr:peptidylprolyl isomerase [Tissierellia bacterium]
MSDSKVMAKVEGKELTKGEVQEFIQLMGPQGAQLNNEDGIKKVADELVNQELMYLEAKEKGYDEDPEFLKEVERIKEQQLKQFAINKLLRQVDVQEEDAKKYYEEHKDQFQTKANFKAAHILVEEEDVANKVLEEINKGKDFGEAAKEYSTCPSKEKGGDLGQFAQGQMVPEFEKALLTQEIGEIAGPVKSQFGYHIIRLDEKNEPTTMEFDQVKNQIIQQITLRKQQELYLEKCKELQGQYKVEKNY